MNKTTYIIESTKLQRENIFSFQNETHTPKSFPNPI